MAARLNRSPWPCVAVLAGLWGVARLFAAPTFEADIRPLLKTHCFHCHGEGDEAPKAGLDLRQRRRIVAVTTDDGPVLTPGDPARSRMLANVRSGKMPKGERKLSPTEVSLIEAWVIAGAPTLHEEPTELPGTGITEEERSFWSFQPVRAVPPPPGAEPHPVDRFLAVAQATNGVAFAPPANPATLVRRLTFDLTGLPPTPESVSAFVSDPAPDAYERLVDRLLASPAYGERWGRHWLDVAGYADSNGFTETDSVRPHAWRYRDYVIRSLNADKPWDRFLQEQLAGDELIGTAQGRTAGVVTNADALELLTATGFLRMIPDGTADSPPDLNLARNEVLAATLKVVGSSVLGLTVGCAQCHDHRYDPLTHVDYTRLRAVWEPAYDWKAWRGPGERLCSLYTPEQRAAAAGIETAAQAIDKAAEDLQKELLNVAFEKELAKLPEEIRGTVRIARDTPPDKRTADQKELLRVHPSADVRFALDLYDPEGNKRVLAKRAEAAQLRGTRPPEDFVMALTEVAGQVPETHRFHRGDHDQPREAVTPGELSVLAPRGTTNLFQLAHSDASLPTSGRRLAYARWLTGGHHPLVARVLVNRFWLLHFGRGLVATPGDFGRLGERPTHPELLDWLADDFVSHGWQLKRLHRLLVTSRAYRQAAVNADSIRTDPDNRWLARFRVRRLDAEAVRDGLLAAVGSLNPAAGGPPVPVAQDNAGRIVVGLQKRDGNGDPVGVDPIGPGEFRRSIYVQVRRRYPLTVLDTFDGPGLTPNCEVRGVTTVAPQALLMMNDDFTLGLARTLANRLRREHPDDVPAQLAGGWSRIFGTFPAAADLDPCLDYYNRQMERFRGVGGPPDPALTALASLCQALLSSNRFLYLE